MSQKTNSCPSSEMLDTVNEHFRDTRITHLRTEHRVIEAVCWPFQLEVFLDERGAVSIGGVDLFNCIVLGIASCSDVPPHTDLWIL
jgi:hypothetical protein